MKKRGRPRTVTPTQELEIWAWYQALQALGCMKSKAAEMGIPMSTLRHVLTRKKLERDREMDKQRRKFLRELSRCPF